jgi:predicted thioesterase
MIAAIIPMTIVVRFESRIELNAIKPAIKKKISSTPFIILFFEEISLKYFMVKLTGGEYTSIVQNNRYKHKTRFYKFSTSTLY